MSQFQKGDRVQLSQEAINRGIYRRKVEKFGIPKGTVSSKTNNGERVSVIMDGCLGPQSFAAIFWTKIEK